jgi:hypothetical protein
MEAETLKLIQTVILLLDKVPESDILLKYNLGKYLKKAKEINKFITNKE